MKLNRKSICALLMAFVIAILVSGCSDTRMGYIDTERVMKESPQIQTIVKAAEDAYQQKNQEVSAKLQEDKASMSDDDFKKAAAQSRSELASSQAAYSSQLKTLVDKTMSEVAADKKLAAIIEKNHISNDQFGQAQQSEFVVQGGIDVTDDVIQKLQ